MATAAPILMPPAQNAAASHGLLVQVLNIESGDAHAPSVLFNLPAADTLGELPDLDVNDLRSLFVHVG